MEGKIIKGVAGTYAVYSSNGVIYECSARGIFRKEHNKPMVGDQVLFDVLKEKGRLGNITNLLPRKNFLFRPSVSNVDQVAVVFACRDPAPNPVLIDRCLAAMESVKVSLILCFTKVDLAEKAECEALSGIYRASGYPVCFLSVRDLEYAQELQRLRELLSGKVTAFAGPSGVGKSSLMNYLHPDAGMETGELSEKIRRGKHTTRHSELFCLEKNTWLFDTPGFGTFELMDMEKDMLPQYFPEFYPYLGKCRFCDCTHIQEPSCAVKEAVAEGRFSASRYESYKLFYQELAARKRY